MNPPEPDKSASASHNRGRWKQLAGVVVLCAIAGIAAAWALPEVLASVEWPRFISKTWVERVLADQQSASEPMLDLQSEIAEPVSKPVATPSERKEPSSATPQPAPKAEADEAGEPASDTPRQPEPRRAREKPPDDRPTDVTYKVDRRSVANIIKSPTDLGKHGRFVPNTVDGQRRGFKFVDVAKGGLFDQLGVRRGDVVLEVNGRALTTQTKLLEDLEALKSAHLYVVRIQRGEATRIHRYDAGPPLKRDAGGDPSQ